MDKKQKKAKAFKDYAEGIALIITALGTAIAMIIGALK